MRNFKFLVANRLFPPFDAVHSRGIPLIWSSNKRTEEDDILKPSSSTFEGLGWFLHWEFQNNLFCCMGPTCLKPLKKQLSWFSPNCLATFLGGGQHICMLLSRHTLTDWQFLCILQKINSDPPGICPCKHASVFAPGWKRVLQKLGTEWGYPFGRKGREKLAPKNTSLL